MKNDQVKITFQDNKQTAVVQITRNGNEVSVSTKFTPELDMAGPTDTPALNWTAVFLEAPRIHCFLNRSRPSALQSLFGMNRRNENGQYCGFSSYS